MKRKVYWKDLFASFTHSKGRFLSILTLMLLGSLALVGLKVTTPNMHRTANQFIQQQQMASRVVKRMALALPVLRMERLAVVMPILSASSLDFIFRLASMTSRLTIIMATSLNG